MVSSSYSLTCNKHVACLLSSISPFSAFISRGCRIDTRLTMEKGKCRIYFFVTEIREKIDADSPVLNRGAKNSRPQQKCSEATFLLHPRTDWLICRAIVRRAVTVAYSFLPRKSAIEIRYRRRRRCRAWRSMPQLFAATEIFPRDRPIAERR